MVRVCYVTRTGLLLVPLLALISLVMIASGDVISWGEKNIIDDSDKYNAVAVGDAGLNGTVDVAGAPDNGGLNLFYNEADWPHTEVDEDEYPYGTIAFAPKQTGAAPSLLAGNDIYNTGIHGWVYDDEWVGAHPEFVIIENQATSVSAGDINGDGDTDIAAGYINDGIKIWYGDGNGGWTEGNPPDGSNTYKAVTLFDMNYDGFADLVASRKEGSTGKGIRIWHSTGTGWRSVASPTNNGEYADIEVGDLEGDGDLDIVAAHRASNLGIHFFQNNSGAWEDNELNYPNGTDGYYNDVAFVDLNHDGFLDVAGAENAGGTGLHVFLALEEGGWSNDLGPDLGDARYNSVEIADIDADGNPDLVGASEEGLVWFPSTLPAITDYSYSKEIFARLRNNTISFSVQSDLVTAGDYSSMSTARITLEATEFTFTVEWQNDGPDDETIIFADTGEIDPGYCPVSAPEDGLFTMAFSFNATWDMPHTSGAVLLLYIEDEMGQSTTMEVNATDIRFYSQIDIIDFAVEDDTLNPGMPMNFAGRLVYYGTMIDIPAWELSKVILARNEGAPDEIAVITDPSNAAFNFTPSAPSEPGELQYFIGFKLQDRPKEYLDSSLLSVKVDYVVMNSLFVDPGSYVFDDQIGDTYRYWDRSGDIIRVRFGATWASGLEYTGESSIQWGENITITTGRALDVTAETGNLVIIDIEPVLNSAAPDALVNPFGPMLIKSKGYNWKIQGCFDGDVPTITAFSEYDGKISLRNGTKIASEDNPVSVLVREIGPMVYLNQTGERIDWGRMLLHWNGSLNGTSVMIGENLDNGSYRFSSVLPLSLADSDDGINFWITGFDSVGHPLVSNLTPTLLNWDERAMVVVDPSPPSVPQGVNTLPGDGYVDIIWVSNPENDLAGYIVYKSVEDEEHFHPMTFRGEIGPNNVSYRDTFVVNDRIYYYYVVAVDNAIIPNYSNSSISVNAIPEAEEDLSLMEQIEEMTGLPLYLIIPVVMLPIAAVTLVVGQRNKKRQDGKEKIGERKEKTGNEGKPPMDEDAPTFAPLGSSSFSSQDLPTFKPLESTGPSMPAAGGAEEIPSFTPHPTPETLEESTTGPDTFQSPRILGTPDLAFQKVKTGTLDGQPGAIPEQELDGGKSVPLTPELLSSPLPEQAPGMTPGGPVRGQVPEKTLGERSLQAGGMVPAGRLNLSVTLPTEDNSIAPGHTITTPGMVQEERPPVEMKAVGKTLICGKCGANAVVTKETPFCENCGNRVVDQ